MGGTCMRGCDLGKGQCSEWGAFTASFKENTPAPQIGSKEITPIPNQYNTNSNGTNTNTNKWPDVVFWNTIMELHNDMQTSFNQVLVWCKCLQAEAPRREKKPSILSYRIIQKTPMHCPRKKRYVLVMCSPNQSLKVGELKIKNFRIF